MIKSMTGFGKSICKTSKRLFSIEIKSYNGKQTDIYLKVPQILKNKEIELRELIINELIRGKIECTITSEYIGEDLPININSQLIKSYYKQLLEISEELNCVNEPLLNIIFRFPEVLKPSDEELEEKDWNEFCNSFLNALNQVNQFRLNEGKALAEDLKEKVIKIKNLLIEITFFEDARINKIKERLKKNLEISLKENEYDKNRFEQELIYYLDKLDINEEKVRLDQHLNHFLDTLNNEENCGRKLQFIAQEMGREINTISSKANDYDIQRITILMKDELEKIKEQVLNVL